MLYIIAMIEKSGVRVYNTTDSTFKDLSLATVARLKGSLEVKNTGPLKEDGTFLIYGGRHNYPIFKIKGTEKRLTTPNIPTVIAHTDAGKTTVVDAFGNKTQRYTRSLSAIALTNAEYTPDGRLVGYFETLNFKDYLEQYESSMSAMSMFMADDSDMGCKIVNGVWEYTGDKKNSKVIVPEGVTGLAPGSLEGVTLSELILPSTLVRLEKGGLSGVFVQIVNVNSGALQKIDNQAFSNTKVRELRIYGNVNIHPMAFYGARIARIYAQGSTYNACLKHKLDSTTTVKVLR